MNNPTSLQPLPRESRERERERVKPRFPRFVFNLASGLTVGLLVGLIVLAFTGPGTRAPGTGNPDFWIKSGNDVYYNVTGGNVGIGTADPGSYKLKVNGSLDATTITQGGSPIGFVDRGDPANNDFLTGAPALTQDGGWHNLDLSSIVPVGAKAVLLRVYMTFAQQYDFIQFRKNGNSNTVSGSGFEGNTTNDIMWGDLVVTLNTNRIIEYRTRRAGAVTDYMITVGGWWF